MKARSSSARTPWFKVRSSRSSHSVVRRRSSSISIRQCNAKAGEISCLRSDPVQHEGHSKGMEPPKGRERDVYDTPLVGVVRHEGAFEESGDHGQQHLSDTPGYCVRVRHPTWSHDL